MSDSVPVAKPVKDTPSRVAEQKPDGDSGLMALALVAQYHQVGCEVAQLQHELGLGTEAASATEIVRAARKLKLKSRLLQKQPLERLEKVPLPAILELQDGGFAVLGRRLND